MTKYDDMAVPVIGGRSSATPRLRIKTIFGDTTTEAFDASVNLFLLRVNDSGGQIQGVLLTAHPGAEWTAFVTYLSSIDLK